MSRSRQTVLAALVLAIPAVGCGGGSSAPARPLPPGYVAFHRNGQFVPTGNPTLDYWVRVNMIHHFSDRPAARCPTWTRAGRGDPGRRPGRGRSRPGRVGRHGGRLPRRPGRSRPPDARRPPDPIAADPAVQQSLAAARADVAHRGDALRASLTRRSGRPFPPCLW
ncbi:hypothetical protein [Fimbriiglobus ruber]|uniref:hypothetical protein n=1 Tax=Fimbriiglobus ruber TaxID=1908690 RepID=UPI00117B36C9|nr:hypothetical protein [Fimbriiglobus ruber]